MNSDLIGALPIIYPIVCPNMELTLLSGKMFPENGRKLESVENKIKKYFIQSLVFNKTIIPPTFVGYELMVADSVLISNVRSWNNFLIYFRLI